MSEVVVGVDGSAAAAGALRWAAEHARSSGCSLRVLHVWDMPPGLAGADLVTRDLRRDLQEVSAEIVAEAVAAARVIGGPDLEIHGEAVCGPVRRHLIRASRRAELLVVGNVGPGRLSGLVLGSVAAHCVRHAVCPIAVVPLRTPERVGRTPGEATVGAGPA